MKAENIPNSNLASKYTICYKKFCVKQIFQNFRLIFNGIFFRNSNFSKNFIYNPKNLWYPLVLNTKKRNLHEGLTILTSSQTKWRAFENAMCTFYPPPLLRLKKCPVSKTNSKQEFSKRELQLYLGKVWYIS